MSGDDTGRRASPRERILRLADGRHLAYAEWGPSDGTPVLAFHGLPNSRLVHFRDAPARNAIRLVLPDRPGFGRSDPQPERTLLGWAHDVGQLADELGLERYAVIGISAGGPHAAACAWALPDQVAALGLVSAVGPVVDEAIIGDGLPPAWSELVRLGRADLVSVADTARRLCAAELHLLRQDAGRWLSEWEAEAPPADRRLIADPAVRAMYVESCLEATLGGYVRELLLLTTKPWGFTSREIKVPTFIWHGTRDTTIPLEVAEHVASLIPGCRATIYPDEGHLLVHAHEDEILREVTVASGSD